MRSGQHPNITSGTLRIQQGAKLRFCPAIYKNDDCEALSQTNKRLNTLSGVFMLDVCQKDASVKELISYRRRLREICKREYVTAVMSSHEATNKRPIKTPLFHFLSREDTEIVIVGSSLFGSFSKYEKIVLFNVQRERSIVRHPIPKHFGNRVIISLREGDFEKVVRIACKNILHLRSRRKSTQNRKKAAKVCLM